jgi:hypothetical protein
MFLKRRFQVSGVVGVQVEFLSVEVFVEVCKSVDSSQELLSSQALFLHSLG